MSKLASFIYFVSRAAVTEDNKIMIKCLLELNAHPNVIDFSGRTALMHVAEHGNVGALQLLREEEANPTIRDFEGKGKKRLFCF